MIMVIDTGSVGGERGTMGWLGVIKRQSGESSLSQQEWTLISVL